MKKIIVFIVFSIIVGGTIFLYHDTMELKDLILTLTSAGGVLAAIFEYLTKQEVRQKLQEKEQELRIMEKDFADMAGITHRYYTTLKP